MVEKVSNTRLTRGGALDALRFLAAGFIVVFHAGFEAPTPLRVLHGFFDRGYLATDFFLMLSGFVLASAYGPMILAGRLSLGQFLVRRLTRLYPAHLIMLGSLVVMVLASAAIGHRLTHPEQYAWSALPAHLLLVHGWGFAPDTWNAPTWSISALVACYAAFPGLWAWLQRLRRTDLCLLTVLVVLAGSDVLAHVLLGRSEFSLPFQWALVRAFPLFLVGLILARLVQVAAMGLMPARLLGLGSSAVFAVNAIASGPDIVAILATVGVVIGCGASPGGHRWPGAAWGSKISFSLFITHSVTSAFYTGIVDLVLARAHVDLTGRWLIWAMELVVALAVAAAYHHLIDEPMQRRLRARLFSPRPGLGRAQAQSA